MGLKVNSDSEEHKLSDTMFEFSIITCLMRSRVPRVSLLSCVEVSKSTQLSSLGLIDLQVLIAKDAILFPIKGWMVGLQVQK